jgi:hypothetical protein
METTLASRKQTWLVWWAITYVLLIVSVVATMFWARGSAIRQLSSPQSLAAWQAWREDVRRQQTQAGPVERRVPKSDEPPALVLWRDYFGVLVAGAVLFTSALYWVIAWFVTGMLRR